MGHLEKLQAQIPFQHYELVNSPGKLLTQPDIVIYPGTSTRRMAFLTQAFPKAEHITVGIGEETQGDIGETMKYKLNEGVSQLPQTEQCVVIVAADQQNITPKIDLLTGSIILTSHQKPKNEEAVLEMFQDMSTFSEETSQNPFYYGDAASGVLHLHNNKATLIEDRKKHLVDFRPERFKELANKHGFRHYLEELKDFYSGPPYTDHNMHLELTHLSAGISLPVLVKMGIVRSIDGVDIENDRFREQLKEAICNVAVGISTALLTTLHVDEQEVIGKWTWLNGVVDKAMIGQIL